MRKRALVVSSLLGAFSVGAFLACSSSSNAPSPAADAGKDGSQSSSDSGGMDSTTGADSGGGGMDSGAPGDTGTGTETGSGDTGSTGDSATDGGGDSGYGDAGYNTLEFDPTGTGSPDAIYWDDTKQILYITDDTQNQLWTYTDAAGFQKYVQVPDSPALDDAGNKTKLNGITELSNGTLVVVRFGYGIQGAIYTVSPDGGTSTVPNVPAARKRITATSDPTTGVIYGDSFTGSGTSTPGEVETVSLTTGPTAYATGFGKTVGLLVQGGYVLVSDETNNAIIAVPTDPTKIADGGAGLVDGAAFPVYATVGSPDQLCAGPNGTIYTDQFQATTDGGGVQVRQIAPDGGVTVLFPGVQFTSLDDVAYDPTNHRLFVVDNNGTTVRTIKVFPVQ